MKQIQLSRGYVAFVDDEDFDCVSKIKWYPLVTRWTVYAYNRAGNYLHRFVLDISDPTIEVDHEDHNGLNCQKQNLRPTSRSGNGRNARKWLSGTSSHFKGVCFFKRDANWQAYINANGKRKHLGYFSTELLAAAAYNQAAQKYFGEFACLNTL